MDDAGVDDAIEEPALGRWEERTDLPLTVLSVGYLGVYAAQVLATRAGRPLGQALDTALWMVWAVFVLDYLIRMVLARRRLRFVARHPIDLLVALAPFFRFLRLLRLLSAVSTLGRTLRDDLRGRVGTYLVVSVSLLSFVAALGVYEVERDAPGASITTFGDALWWVLTSITTVGDGDRYPVTVEGRLVAAGLMIAGIAVLGTVTAAIATWFLEQVGARDPSDAVRTDRSRPPVDAVAAPDTTPIATPPSTTTPTATPTAVPTTTPAASAAEVAALAAEVRALRALLDARSPDRVPPG